MQFIGKNNEIEQFDRNLDFGPRIGMTRLQRWERAATFGLNPNPELLQEHWKTEMDVRYIESAGSLK